MIDDVQYVRGEYTFLSLWIKNKVSDCGWEALYLRTTPFNNKLESNEQTLE